MQKLMLLTALYCLSLTAHAQNDVALNKDSTYITAAPIEGKAIIYIVRPTELGFLVKMKLYCDTSYLGSTMAEKYVYTVVDPGKHVLVSKSENKYKLEITVEPGKIYYIKQQVKMGVLYAETKLKMLDEEEGKKYLSKCKLSKDNIYSQ